MVGTTGKLLTFCCTDFEPETVCTYFVTAGDVKAFKHCLFGTDCTDLCSAFAHFDPVLEMSHTDSG